MFPSAKRIELTHFVISPLPFLFKPFHHRVPLSSEVSQMSGSSLCFLCLFDGFIVRKIIVEPSFTAGGVGGTGPLVLFHPLRVSVFCLFSKKKKNQTDAEQKRIIHPLRSENTGSCIRVGSGADALLAEICNKGFCWEQQELFLPRSADRGQAGGCSLQRPRAKNYKSACPSTFLRLTSWERCWNPSRRGPSNGLSRNARDKNPTNHHFWGFPPPPQGAREPFYKHPGRGRQFADGGRGYCAEEGQRHCSVPRGVGCGLRLCQE